MWRVLWARAGSSCIDPAHTLAKIHLWTHPTAREAGKVVSLEPRREDTVLVSSPVTQGPWGWVFPISTASYPTSSYVGEGNIPAGESQNSQRSAQAQRKPMDGHSAEDGHPHR